MRTRASIETIGGWRTSAPERTALGILVAILLVILPFGHTSVLRQASASLIALLVAAAIATRRRGRLPAGGVLSAWIALCALSALWSANASMTLRAVYLDWILSAGVFYACHVLSQREGTWRRLSLILLMVNVLLLGQSAYTYAEGGYATLMSHQMRSGLMRWYPGPGVASTYATLTLPLAVAWLTEAGWRRWTMPTITLVAACVIGALSQNRVFWLGFMMMAVFAFLAVWPVLTVRRRIVGALVVALLCLAGGIGFVKVVTQRSPTAAPPVASVEHAVEQDPRLKGWQYWSRKAAQAPALGFGYGKKALALNLTAAEAEQISNITTDLLGHAHNLLLDVVLQTGIVGFALFCWLLAALAGSYWRLSGANRYARTLATAGILLIVGMLMKSVTDDFFDNPMILVFWSIAGMLMGRLNFFSATDIGNESPASSR